MHELYRLRPRTPMVRPRVAEPPIRPLSAGAVGAKARSARPRDCAPPRAHRGRMVRAGVAAASGILFLADATSTPRMAGARKQIAALPHAWSRLGNTTPTL